MVRAEADPTRLRSVTFEIFPSHNEDTAQDITFYLQHEHGSLFWVEFTIIDRSHLADLPVEISSSAQHEQSMQQARAWVSHCRRNHELCRTSLEHVDITPLPTRLVYIQYLDGKWHASLKMTQNLHPSPATPEIQYATLSHAWGTQKFMTLTTTNYQSFAQGIPIELLSRCFQDAIHVTSALGLQYIWIDSLCIVQDSLADWETESLRMSYVYQNAFLNLSVSGFASGMDGFLPASREPDPTPPIVRCPSHGSARDYMLSEKMPWRGLWGSPLFERAWVLQEQILNARAIHFGKDQMHWECRQQYANEIFPHGWSPEKVEPQLQIVAEPEPTSIFQRIYRADHALQPFWHFSLHRKHNIDQSARPDVYRLWLAMVQDYSTRTLTYASDREVAIAGLAAAVHSLLSRPEPLADAYLGGLWRIDLHHGLLWREMSVESDLKSIADSQFASWSWLSCKTPVEWVYGAIANDDCEWSQSSDLITLLPKDSNLSHGSLRIEGWPFDMNPLCEFIGVEEEQNSILPQAMSFAHILGLSMKIAYDPDHWYAQHVYGAGTPDTESLYRALMQHTIILPTLCWRSTAGLPRHTVGVDCVLLAKNKSLGRGTYRRVGTALIDCSELFGSIYPSIKSHHHQYQPSEPEAEFEITALATETAHASETKSIFLAAFVRQTARCRDMLSDDYILQRNTNGSCILDIV
ncbi:hypothetical protein ACN47E_002871 [Coniothyrium glycines]